MKKIFVLTSIIILLSSITGLGAITLTNFDAAIPNEVNNMHVSCPGNAKPPTSPSSVGRCASL